MTYPTHRGFVAFIRFHTPGPMPDRAALALGYTVMQWTENFFNMHVYCNLKTFFQLRLPHNFWPLLALHSSFIAARLNVCGTELVQFTRHGKGISSCVCVDAHLTEIKKKSKKNLRYRSHEPSELVFLTPDSLDCSIRAVGCSRSALFAVTRHGKGRSAGDWPHSRFPLWA